MLLDKKYLIKRYTLCNLYFCPSLGITSNNNNNNNNNNGSNGNGISTSFTDKDSLTPSPPQRPLSDSDVKSEPMDMVCGGSNNNLPSDDHSNDSSGEPDGKYMGLGDGKGSLR